MLYSRSKAIEKNVEVYEMIKSSESYRCDLNKLFIHFSYKHIKNTFTFR
jgi:hypothetical protein